VIAAKLVELIENHASGLTSDVVQDLLTNARTRGFRAVSADDLEERIFQIVHHLGNWIGDPKSVTVRAEFEDWGRRRFEQGIPLSEILYARKRSAELRPIHRAILNKLRDHAFCSVDRYSKAHADRSTRRRQDLRIYPDHPPEFIEQRPAGVSRIDRGIRLDRGVDRTVVPGANWTLQA